MIKVRVTGTTRKGHPRLLWHTEKSKNITKEKIKTASCRKVKREEADTDSDWLPGGLRPRLPGGGDKYATRFTAYLDGHEMRTYTRRTRTPFRSSMECRLHITGMKRYIRNCSIHHPRFNCARKTVTGNCEYAWNHACDWSIGKREELTNELSLHAFLEFSPKLIQWKKQGLAVVLLACKGTQEDE